MATRGVLVRDISRPVNVLLWPNCAQAHVLQGMR
jgi:hypothetical protein